MFQRTKKLIIAALCSLSVTVMPISVWAMPIVLPFHEVQAGMVGEARTVLDISGDIKIFPVEIIGKLEGGKGSSRMIMARTEGEFIEQVGGVMQGMSGSPIYVNGKLIGALSAGIRDLNPYTFFITPIEDMTTLWDMPDTKNKTVLGSIDIVKANKNKLKQAGEREDKELEKEFAKLSDDERQAAWEARLQVIKDDKVKEYEDGERKTREAKEEKLIEDYKLQQEEIRKQVNPADTGDSDKPTKESEIAEADTAKDTPALSQSEAKPAEKQAEDNIIVIPEKISDKEVELKTNLVAGGFDTKGLKFLEQQLGSSVELMPMGGATGATKPHLLYEATMEGGSPVGVALAYGDFSIGATGTVTAVDGKRVVAFGHPFLHKGNVNYFMTKTEVIGTISGQSNGIKVANMDSIIGRINQDRSTGVAGVIGEFPAAIPLQINVKDRSLGKDVSYNTHIAYDEELMTMLIGSMTYSALNKTSDNIGAGTAKIDFRIRTDALEQGFFERQNVYYSQADLGAMVVTELMQAMSIIANSAEREAGVLDVVVDIELDSERKTAVILTAMPDKQTVKAGETITFTATLKPYRRPEETVKLKYKIPEEQLPGTVNLELRGGGLVLVSPLMLLEGMLAMGEEQQITTADRLRELGNMGQNNEIIIAPGAMPVPTTEKEQKKHIRKMEKLLKKQAEKQLNEPKIKLLADRELPRERNIVPYIIENMVQATLKVEAD